MELFDQFFFPALIRQTDLQTFCQERHLTESLFQGIKIKYGFFKDLFIRQERYHGSCFFRITVSNDL